MREIKVFGALGIVMGSTLGIQATPSPNIVFILADDLGYAELGCYGQQKIQTPNLDRLREQGMKFTAHYSGAPVCAPARCSLMTGKHLGHTFVRGNMPHRPEGQVPIPAIEITIAELLKKRGYTTGAFGKWGLGYPGSEGDALNQGFDRFFGYNCQRHAHSLYPGYLWDDDKRIELNNVPAIPGHGKLSKDADPTDPASYEKYRGKDFAPDRINEQVVEFIRDNKDKPFFLYYPAIIPHLALQVPDDEILKRYETLNWEDPPHAAGYTSCYHPRATYAALITRLDGYVGRVLDELKKQGIEDNTIVIFTSDNGATYLGPMAEFFKSDANLRGLKNRPFYGGKGSLYEGGVREPLLVRWPGKVKPGSECDWRSGFEDWLPTLLDMVDAGKLMPKGLDGISFMPSIMGQKQAERPWLYREFPEYGGSQAVWMGDWKGIRGSMQKGNLKLELYNLASDEEEQNNVASRNPEIIAKMLEIMQQEHEFNVKFPIKALDAGK